VTEFSQRQVRSGLAAGLILLLSTVAPVGSAETGDDDPEKSAGPLTIYHSAPVTPYHFDGNARDLPAPKPWKPGDPVREIPRRAYPHPSQQKDDRRAANQGLDPLLRVQQNASRAAANRAFGAPDRNFEGQGFSGVNPPDTVGDVGPNHYVQMINDSVGSTVEIYDKALPTPSLVANFTLDSMGSGACANGAGDPIVLYDRFADRWLLTEFGPTSGSELCMYVSQTADPTGSYFFYLFSTVDFPDYPKYGVWPTDANGGSGSYLVTTNEATSGVYAMDRAAMIAGTTASFQRFTIPDLPGFSFNAVTPADLDGPNAPPVGTPAVIMRQRDTEAHSGPAAPGDVIEMWHFDVDWITTANTTFTQLTDLDVADFESDLCGLTAFACFPQPGTGTTLDPLREPIMNRLQYLNFGDHESLVGNFVTDVDGTDHGGLRWFEVRRVGGAASPWTLHQEGTYAPDADHRWMAASAMDQSGNIAIAYNVSSTVTFPSLRYTGRLADDMLGAMTQGETSIVAGAASNSSNRYGDYSSMNLDPSDDCTFWFTGEYNPASNWSTRISSFRFDACGCDLFPLPLTISGGVGGPNQIDLSWNDSELADVVEYRVMRSRTAGGPYTTIATISDSSPGTGNGASYNHSDTTVSGGIDYYYVVRASDGGACTSDVSNELAVTATGTCTLAPLFDGLQTVETPNNGICTLNLDWNAAAPECEGPITYSIHRSTSPGFTPAPGNLLTTTVATNYSDADQLISGVDYYYIVRAADDSNGVSETNAVEVTGIPAGIVQPPAFTDDGGDTGVAQLIASGPWNNEPTGGNNGPGVYATGDYGDNTCADLVTPSINLGIGNMLTFWSTYDIENSYDKGEVQVSDNGGGSWTRLEVGYPGTSTHATDACGFPTDEYFTGTDSNWNQYVGDLSPWDGQTVLIRWVMSTDGSVTRTIGWVLDDIVVGSGAAACATASACDDNPIVDVTPDGPLSECSLSIPLLTANTSGGVGPFTYQWDQDGSLIAGATNPTFQPVDGGTHSYNVRVQAPTCPDEVSDGQGTTIAVESAPQFAGVVSATDQQAATCGIDIDWNSASTICPGPIVYDVYRSTNPGVAPVPGNRIAAGLSGTSHTDTASLMDTTVYHYLVQARDLSTSVADGNTVEDSTAPSGPDAISFQDDAGDTVAADLVPTAPWSIAASGGNNGPGVYTTGDYGNNTCSDLVSGPIPIGTGETLSFWSSFDIENSWDKGEVQISADGGANWSRLEMAYPGTSTQTADACGLPTDEYFTGTNSNWTEYTADLSSWAGQTVILRWEMSTDGSVTRTLGWNIDDVKIFSPQVCVTASTGPPPAPDGSSGTIPLRGENLAAGVGDTLGITWDASCSASSYNLIYGDLANVSTYALTGSECGIGASGSYTWNGVPAGNLYFLIVGTDGAGVESSWGSASTGAERNAGASSAQCAVASKDPSGVCP